LSPNAGFNKNATAKDFSRHSANNVIEEDPEENIMGLANLGIGGIPGNNALPPNRGRGNDNIHSGGSTLPPEDDGAEFKNK
jgi:hypothetical protein